METSQKNEYLLALEKEEAKYYAMDEDKDVCQVDSSSSMSSSFENSPPTTRLYNLDSSVHVWSDYLRLHLHPKTVFVVNQYHHDIEQQSFDLYPYGMNVWKNEETENEVVDRIRFFVEECDSLQGFHMLLDCDNGFSGLGISVLQYLQDEYDRKSFMVFPCLPASHENSTPQRDNIRVINTALCFDALAKYSSLYSPVSLGITGWRTPGPHREFPYLNYSVSLPYHTSAILSTALDTVTLPYRMKNSHISLGNLTHEFSMLGRKVAAMSLTLPLATSEQATLFKVLGDLDGTSWTAVTPSCDISDHCWIQSIVIRGVNPDLGRSDEQKAANHACSWAACNTAEEMLHTYLQHLSSHTISGGMVTKEGCRVSIPFPHIFTEDISQEGFLAREKRSPNIGVRSVPVMAGIHSSAGIGSMLDKLHSTVARLNIKKFHQYVDAGLEIDDYQECLQDLLTLRHCYAENEDM